MMEKIFYYQFLNPTAQEYYRDIAERYMFEDLKIDGRKDDLREAAEALLLDDPYFFCDIGSCLKGDLFVFSKDEELNHKMSLIRKSIWVDIVSNFKTPIEFYLNVFAFLIRERFRRYGITDEDHFFASKLLYYAADLQDIPCIMVKGEKSGRPFYWNIVEASGSYRHCIREDELFALHREADPSCSYDKERFDQIFWWQKKTKERELRRKGTEYLKEKISDYLDSRCISYRCEDAQYSNKLSFYTKDLFFTVHYNSILNALIVEFHIALLKHDQYREKMKDLDSYGVSDDHFVYSICLDPDKEEHGVYEILNEVLEDENEGWSGQLASLKKEFEDLRKTKGEKKDEKLH